MSPACGKNNVRILLQEVYLVCMKWEPRHVVDWCEKQVGSTPYGGLLVKGIVS